MHTTRSFRLCVVVLVVNLVVGAAWSQPAPAPLPALKRVVFLGDSITVGVGVSNKEQKRYSSVAAALLRREFPALEEINLGSSGAGLSQQAENYPETVLAQTPDAVVIQWGVNDQYWGFSVPQFAVNYERLVAALRKAKPDMPIVVCTLVPDFRFPDAFDVWIGAANVAIQEIAAKYRCRVAYVHEALEHQREKFQPDTIHPNDAGAQRMGEAVYAAFRSEPLSEKNLNISFDQGQDVRFRQWVFIPKRTDMQSSWAKAERLGPGGFQLITSVPLTVRTAPLFAEGTYVVEIKDAGGERVGTQQAQVTWQRLFTITIDPGTHPMPLTVSIRKQ
ncbi:MAG: hypothetical protein A3K19_17550 [Lentisphaerae bacterium RIFOXYB12_FULL_65_16]|nr:MAG: hypothetical protein A3K18_17160 [Lentisphaerae bacterium RIFOXYA12_64_32]OGV85606.1 MAG: hypothetical protein A3K19_17550 [Lentisphaerae bacterium RIFOXYB12_FULL_65_16]